MSFFGKFRSSKPAAPDEMATLTEAVRAHLGQGGQAQVADADVQIVTAVSGLLGAVAYADREHGAEEEAHIQTQLRQIDGLDRHGAKAIVDVLKANLVPLSSTYVQRFTRTLTELTSVEMRLEVLDVLLGLAAADGVITHDEIVSLRNLTSALGLSQDDYNRLQAKYKDALYFT